MATSATNVHPEEKREKAAIRDAGVDGQTGARGSAPHS